MISCNLIFFPLPLYSLVAQTVKRLPAMRETWVQSLGWEDLLEKEMATQSSILTWKIPWTEEPGQAIVHGVAKSRTRLSSLTHSLTHPYSGPPPFSLPTGNHQFSISETHYAIFSFIYFHYLLTHFIYLLYNMLQYSKLEKKCYQGNHKEDKIHLLYLAIQIS